MLAGRERGLHDFEVTRYFDADDDEIDVIALYEFAKVTEARPRTEGLSGFSRAIVIARRDGREREVW